MTVSGNEHRESPMEALRIISEAGEVVRNGVLREFTDPRGTSYRSESPRAAIDRFMEQRGGDLKAGGADLRELDSAEGAGTLRVRYGQFHNDLPVLGATLQAVASMRTNSVVKVSNAADQDLSGAPSPEQARSIGELHPTVLAPFEAEFGSAEIVGSQLAYLRDVERPSLPEADYPTASVALLSTGTPPDGAVHLVHDVKVQTGEPFEIFRVVVDAVTPTVLWIELLSKYVTASLRVFVPDPVSESDDATLHGGSSAAALDQFLHPVQAEIEAATGGTFHLRGDWVNCDDWDTPAFPQPAEPTPTFDYQSYPADRRSLSANAYFWLDSFARYLRTFGNTTLNANMVRVDVDAQGFDGADNSQWLGATNPPRIRHGEGGAPDAADMSVIIHEYMHGVFDFLGSNHGGSLSYEHSFCDAVPAIYRDRFNANQHRRTETFPFDNNATNRWSDERTLDRAERFDDAGFAGYGFNLRNSMLGTAVWESYLGMGGGSPDPLVRRRAADALIATVIEMLLITPDDSSTDAAHARRLAQDLIVADMALTGGLYSKVMDEAFVRRGLWARRTVDLYITDSAGDVGVIPSPAPHWTSPDIWVRNLAMSDGDDPEQGHQAAIEGQPNHLYVRLRNRGARTAPADTFQVEVFRCDPATATTWPDHFQSLGTLTVADPVPAGGALRVGPFTWTPQSADEAGLVALVHGTEDPAITATLLGSVPHEQLARFDNNIGQRTVAVQAAEPDGRLRTSGHVPGATADTRFSLPPRSPAAPVDEEIR
ncbi:hypothetical protein ACU610_05810 [Geodermatophilus sp. URMC 61]|uniref:hypothetical protein n=1 Tax=Geodermatophilus sp. URMC 61 TaxID=3423411 RepID=UPI00406CBBD0